MDAAANARRVLPKLAESYFDAGRKAASRKRSAKALHRFRISTKRFRYALELFQPVYDGNLDRRLKALRKLQDALGAISDCQTILEILKEDKAVESKVKRVMSRRTKEFRTQWQAFDSPGQLKQWKDFLGRESRSQPPRRSAA